MERTVPPTKQARDAAYANGIVDSASYESLRVLASLSSSGIRDYYRY